MTLPTMIASTIRFSAVLGVLFAMVADAPSTAAPSASPVQPPVPRWRGTVDLSMGGEANAVGADFARVSGIAVDEGGRIFVSDGQDQLIRVFSAAGALQSTIGRKGSGPTEFKGLSAIAIANDGKLWARDDGNARMTRFDISKPAATYETSVTMQKFTSGSITPITFERGGERIDESTSFDEKTEIFRPVRVRVAATGHVLRIDTLPIPDGAFSGQHTVVNVQKDAKGNVIGMRSRIRYQPHGPQWLRAYGVGGVRADAVGSKYAVRIFDASGALVRTLTRSVPAVPLSLGERKRADSLLKAWAEVLPFGVPKAKPPIVGLHWTQEGELWIERSMPDGQPREADVYDTKGQRIAVAEWPRSINLMANVSLIRGRTAYGLMFDASDVPQVVRLPFR